ncbi:hypothetical protein J7M23_05470 [Candidatus Sumerlaeota bacterium]|nr:hypothetical protein [Candidatus Sumerlaeota bacterium]
MGIKRRQKLWVYLALFLSIIITGVVIFWGYYFISLNIWINQTNPELEEYPYRLIAERKIVSRTPPVDTDVATIERVLIEEITKDRIVVNLSRSEIRFSPFRHKAYVKVYLETAVPEKSIDKRVKVKLLEILQRKHNHWYLVGTSNLLIQ